MEMLESKNKAGKEELYDIRVQPSNFHDSIKEVFSINQFHKDHDKLISLEMFLELDNKLVLSYELHGVDLLLDEMAHLIGLDFGFVEGFECVERIVESVADFVDGTELAGADFL